MRLIPKHQNSNGKIEYQRSLKGVGVDSEGNLLDPNVPSARGTVRLPEVTVTASRPLIKRITNGVKQGLEDVVMGAGNLLSGVYGAVSYPLEALFGEKDTYANAHNKFGEGYGHERDNIVNVHNNIAGQRKLLEMMGYRDVNGKLKYPKFKSDSEYMEWCAENANVISRYFGRPTTGHAWTRHGIYGDSAIVQAPYTKDEYWIPKARNKARSMSKDLARYVEDYIDDEGVELKSGDIVDMRYPKSSFTEEAWNTGDRKLPNTHTGTIIKTGPRKEDTYVAHYFKGLQVEPIGDLLGVNWVNPYITGIRRPGTKKHPYKARGGNPHNGKTAPHKR